MKAFILEGYFWRTEMNLSEILKKEFSKADNQLIRVTFLQ